MSARTNGIRIRRHDSTHEKNNDLHDGEGTWRGDVPAGCSCEILLLSSLACALSGGEGATNVEGNAVAIVLMLAGRSRRWIGSRVRSMSYLSEVK